jgi:hypothetical protein
MGRKIRKMEGKIMEVCLKNFISKSGSETHDDN